MTTHSRNPCLCVVLVCCLLVGQVISTDPVAPHLFIEVAPSAEVVIRLTGYDADGDSLKVTVKTLPTTGSLHQLTQVFSDYGYNPKRGSALAVGANVTGSGNRIVYARPSIDRSQTGKWGQFQYTVSDGSTESKPGIVTLVDANKVAVGSSFFTYNEGWKVVGNQNPAAPAFDGSSVGTMNHFIHATDDVLDIDRVSGNDNKRWFFQAPNKFMGDQSITYSGNLKFRLSSVAGDFSSSNLNSPADFVILECDTCDTNSGVRLVRRLDAGLSFDGTTTDFSLKLKEDAGWLRDPKSSLSKWNPPSQCDFIEVLSGLSSIRILGDYTRWYENVSLDEVQLTIGARNSIPITCYS